MIFFIRFLWGFFELFFVIFAFTTEKKTLVSVLVFKPQSVYKMKNFYSSVWILTSTENTVEFNVTLCVTFCSIVSWSDAWKSIDWPLIFLYIYFFFLFLFAIKKMLARIANFNNDRPHDRQSNIFMFNTKWTNLISLRVSTVSN